MKQSRWTFAPILAAALTLASCATDRAVEEHAAHGSEEHAHGTEEHDHGSESHGEHGPGGHDDHGSEGHTAHGAGGHDDHGSGGHDDHGGERPSEVVTLWGETTQLFVEFPALVVGEESPFAAHLTMLADHRALDAGTVVVELSGGSSPAERFAVNSPSRTGIFRPVVRPDHIGVRRVVLRLQTPSVLEVHDMGEFTVFRTVEEAESAAVEGHDEEGAISFLLEQQWQIPFGIEVVELRRLRPNFPAFATLTYPSDAETIVTAPRRGRVAAAAEHFPVVGLEVAAGDDLFSLSLGPQEATDPASLDLAVDEASIRRDATQREVDRLEPLVEQGVVAERRLDQARSALSEAQAQLRSARRRRGSFGQSQRVEGNGDSLMVPSPIPGTLVELYVAPGVWVSEGQPVARIVDRHRLWLDIAVPEVHAGRIHDAPGAWFQFDSFDETFEVTAADLVAVGTEIDRQTRTVPLRFRIANGTHALFAGMSTQAHVLAGSPRRGAAVRADAIIDDGRTEVLYVQTGGETFERRQVVLGIRDGEYVEVIDGVTPGEWVVTRGVYSVKLASSSTETIGHGHAH